MRTWKYGKKWLKVLIIIPTRCTFPFQWFKQRNFKVSVFGSGNHMLGNFLKNFLKTYEWQQSILKKLSLVYESNLKSNNFLTYFERKSNLN